ncbi:MAG: hypothetical protein GWO24_27235, partial [Akkermansiaceae bacterium]|nr:hypothetical protein [Akkermansiaceae bacterium]
YAGLPLPQAGGSRLRRDEAGLRKDSTSAWVLMDGALANFSTNRSKVAEGACGLILDLASLTNKSSNLHLAFDYTMASAAESLHVHLWGYVDVSSASQTPTLNL